MGEYCNTNKECCCQKENTCSCGCQGKHHIHEHDDHCHCADKFLTIADEAWVELLKEKIKEKILEHKGEKIEQLAEIIAKANGERWRNKIKSKTKCHEFKENLKKHFSSHD